jgi:hypothetical protein
MSHFARGTWAEQEPPTYAKGAPLGCASDVQLMPRLPMFGDGRRLGPRRAPFAGSAGPRNVLWTLDSSPPLGSSCSLAAEDQMQFLPDSAQGRGGLCYFCGDESERWWLMRGRFICSYEAMGLEPSHLLREFCDDSFFLCSNHGERLLLATAPANGAYLLKVKRITLLDLDRAVETMGHFNETLVENGDNVPFGRWGRNFLCAMEELHGDRFLKHLEASKGSALVKAVLDRVATEWEWHS